MFTTIQLNEGDITMTKVTIQLFIAITAILCITAIELYALYLNMNGLILAGAIGLIAGIAGFEAKAIGQLINGKRPPE